jgi:hypothetical protein
MVDPACAPDNSGMQGTQDIRRWTLVPETARAAGGIRRYRLQRVAPLAPALSPPRAGPSREAAAPRVVAAA